MPGWPKSRKPSGRSRHSRTSRPRLPGRDLSEAKSRRERQASGNIGDPSNPVGEAGRWAVRQERGRGTSHRRHRRQRRANGRCSRPRRSDPGRQAEPPTRAPPLGCLETRDSDPQFSCSPEFGRRSQSSTQRYPNIRPKSIESRPFLGSRDQPKPHIPEGDSHQSWRLLRRARPIPSLRQSATRRSTAGEEDFVDREAENDDANSDPGPPGIARHS
jgi:hypothetical protein